MSTQRDDDQSSTTADQVRAFREQESLLATAAVTELVAQLDPAVTRAAQACADAELDGDPEAAWEHYRQIGPFSESLHGERLRQLVELGTDAPGWVWSRWITVQARRSVWTGSDSGHSSSEAAEAVRIAYPRGVDPADLGGLSPSLFAASLHERDWLVRQLTVYESGRLAHLVRHLAGARLLEGADQPAAWAAAPMGGYRRLGHSGGVLQVRDLGSGDTVELLDLGLATEHWPGQDFLGRVVPTRDGPGRMFEWRPLPVGKVTAQRVADRPGQWLETLTTRSHREVLPPMWSYVGDEELVADLPLHSWVGLLDRDGIDALPHRDGVISYDDVATAALQRLLTLAAHPVLPTVTLRQFAWTLLLRAGTDEVVRRSFAGREHATAWHRLERVLPGPASRRCRAYADLGTDRAA